MTGTMASDGEPNPDGVDAVRTVTRPLGRADWISAVVIGGSFLVTALGLAAFTRSVSTHQWLALILLVAVYVFAFRTEYSHPQGSTVPTEPVLVALLFLAPTTLIPVAVLVAQLLAGMPPRRGTVTIGHEVLVRMISGWHCVGPVVVFLIAGVGQPEASRWPIYVAALLAQFACDGITAVARQFWLGTDLRLMRRPMAWTFGVDILLSIIGFCAVAAGHGSLTTVALVAVPAALIALLINDRRGLAEKEVHLGRAVEDAREEARIDPLTGLGNRRAWYEAVDQAEAQVTVPESGLVAGLVAADLNHLKYANDSLGHEVGDDLIKAMAEVTRSVAPPGSTVCRVGGDEFAILVVAPARDLNLPDLMQTLRDAVLARGRVSGIALSAALGSAMCPPEPTLADAFRAADTAVFAEKRAGRASRPEGRPPTQRVSADRRTVTSSD